MLERSKIRAKVSKDAGEPQPQIWEGRGHYKTENNPYPKCLSTEEGWGRLLESPVAAYLKEGEVRVFLVLLFLPFHSSLAFLKSLHSPDNCDSIK